MQALEELILADDFGAFGDGGFDFKRFDYFPVLQEADFEEVGLPLAAYEKLASIQASILAAVEFAPPEGKNNPQCIVCARNDIAALRELLKEKKRPEGRLQEHLH